MISEFGLTKRDRFVLYSDLNMAKARHWEPEWQLGAAREIGAICLVMACMALWLISPQPRRFDPIDASALGAAALDLSRPGHPMPASWGSREAAPLFGLDTAPIVGEVAAKWSVVAADIDAQLAVLAHCRAGAACPAVAQDLLKIAAKGAGRDGLARVGLINRAVDLAIKATSDEAQWGVADHWSPPFETLETRRGDCEDYAILKYAALLAAGVSGDDVKVVILRNQLPNEDHAVTAVRVDGEWLILDDSKLALVRDTDMVGAMPRFVLDETGARRFVAAGAGGQGQSVSRSNAPARLMRPV
jgi:predicted transglutaminase-like cysteine proteinase